jgi:macrodomain Ter protein organizer (MatP/YcbG family)
MIGISDVEKALQFLAETDEENANAKANVEFQKHKAKTAYAVEFVASPQNTVSAREAEAQTSSLYQAAQRAHRDATFAAELIRTRRKHAELQVEVWRSINAGRRAGQIP